MADRAAGAQVAAVFGKRSAHVGGGAVAVVGQRFHDDRHAAGAIALVAHFLVVLGIALGGLVDRPLDVVLGHRLRLGGVDRGAQARVHVRVGHAHLGGHGDLAGELGELRRALLVLRALAMHDVLEFGMAGHGSTSAAGWKWRGPYTRRAPATTGVVVNRCPALTDRSGAPSPSRGDHRASFCGCGRSGA